MDYPAWLSKVFDLELLEESGHGQRRADKNLGLGHIYYGLVRTYRPKVIVVIGSWRGFVPIVLARAQLDNVEGGRVIFIDPSMADDFWKKPEDVFMHFSTFGVAATIEHHCMTTQEFVKTDAYKELGGVGMLFVDGMHTAYQAKFDHQVFRGKMVNAAAPVLFHDSLSEQTSTMYEQPYKHSVYEYMVTLRQRGYDIFHVPVGPGLAIVTYSGTED